jgi:hypothetical protein
VKTGVGMSTINIPGCISKKVASKGCDGHCMSSAVPKLSGTGDFTKTCSCCSPVHHVVKQVTLYCTKGHKKIPLPVAERCKCRPC